MEYYSKCNVCGKITCYTDNDLKNNKDHAFITTLASISTIANAVAGTKYDMYESNKLADRESSKIVDYSKCPNCGSKDTVLVTKKFAIYSNKVNHAYSIDDLLKEAKIYLEKQDYENAFCFATMVLNEDDRNYQSYLIRLLASYEVTKLSDLNNINVDYSENQHFINLLEISDEKQKNSLLEKCLENKKAVIKNDIEQFLAGFSDDNFIEQVDDRNYVLEKIDNYVNTLEENNLTEYGFFDRLNEKRKILLYSKACDYFILNHKDYVTTAKEIFEELDDYKDAKEKVEECNAKLNKLVASSKKWVIGTISTLVIIVVCIILYAVLSTPIKLSKVEKYIEQKDYKNAYDILINTPESNKKDKYLSEILKHGRYVIKKVNGIHEDRVINYEYDEKGKPKKIVEEYLYDYETKFKYEYLFEYNYKQNDILSLTVVKNDYISDMDKIWRTWIDEYTFYNDEFSYNFTFNTSYDDKKYEEHAPINYLYINNVKKIKHTFAAGNSETIELNKDGYLKELNVNKKSNSIEIKGYDDYDKEEYTIILTTDKYGLITEYNYNNDEDYKYTIERKYKNGLLISKCKEEDYDEETHRYEYDQHNNFIRIEIEDTSTLKGAADDIITLKWEWINY